MVRKLYRKGRNSIRTATVFLAARRQHKLGVRVLLLADHASLLCRMVAGKDFYPDLGKRSIFSAA